MPSYTPHRGDVIWADLNPQKGHEQAGKRPVLVLSPENYNETVGLAIICPITNQMKGYPFEVMIPEGNIVKGVILSDHIKSIDWRAREVKLIGKLPNSITDDVLEKLNTLLTVT